MNDTIAYRDLFLEELDEQKEAQIAMHRLLTTTPLATAGRLVAVMTLHLQQTKLHIDRLEWIVQLFRDSAGFGLAEAGQAANGGHLSPLSPPAMDDGPLARSA